MKEANEFFAGQVDVLTVQLVGSRSGGKNGQLQATSFVQKKRLAGILAWLRNTL